jgi:hypothetical protein
MIYDVIATAEALALPTDAMAATGKRLYIERLIGLSTIARHRWVVACASRAAVAVLWESGRSPVLSELQRAIGDSGAKDVSANDLARLTSRFLVDQPFLEELVGLDDALWDDAKSACSDSCRCESPAFHRALEHTLVYAAIGSRWAGRHPLIAVSEEWALGDSTSISVELILVEGPKAGHLSALPANLSGVFPVIMGEDSFARAVDLVKLWAASATLEHATSVIRLACALALVENTAVNVSLFSIRAELLVSAEQYGFRHEAVKARRLIDAIVNLLSGKAMANVHALRVSAGGASEPVRRGSAVAFRLDVDRDFHVHYWRCEGDLIELTVLVPHNDFSIPV